MSTTHINASTTKRKSCQLHGRVGVGGGNLRSGELWRRDLRRRHVARTLVPESCFLEDEPDIGSPDEAAQEAKHLTTNSICYYALKYKEKSVLKAEAYHGNIQRSEVAALQALARCSAVPHAVGNVSSHERLRVSVMLDVAQGVCPH